MLTATENEVKSLREWRQTRYLTLGELAALVGVHKQTVYAWEKGAFKPGYTHLRALAQALGIEPGQIEEAKR